MVNFAENIKAEENAAGYFKYNNLKNKIKINYLNTAGIKTDEAVIRFLDDAEVSNSSNW
jgi:hypothetical protein